MTCGCKVRTAVVGLAALMAVCFLPELLSAYEYRVPILVDDEDDIYEMLLAEDISDDEKDTLLELYRNPMDINKASRRALYDLPGLTYALVDAILEYRKDSPFTRASQLKKVAGITDDIYVQLKPFVRIVASRQKRPGKRKPSKIQGQVRAKVADRIKGEGRNTTSEPDDKYPESYLRVKVTDNSRWEVGALVSTENTIGSVSSIGHHMDQWVPVVDDSGLPKDFDDDKYFYLKTSGETYLPAWPKAYAAFEFGDLEVLVGSYRMGFGQRLTFDSLGRQNPYGFSPDLFVNESEYSFTPSKGQFGAVATIPIVKRGGIRLEATPFFSWWRYDAYQYIVRHREKGFCFNNDNHERGIDDPHCYESYAILQPYQDTDSYLQLTSQTLPRAYSELMGGANVTLFFNDRSHLGITGYTSFMDFHLGDEQTVFFGNTEIPERDLFGAVGLDGAFGTGGLALFAEAAVLDNLAYAGLVRGLFEIGDFIIEGSVRYYDEDYNNPHSRG